MHFVAKFLKNISYFFREYGETIRIIGLVVAGIFILNEYLVSQRANREVRALEYVFRAYQPEILAARMQTEMAPLYPPMVDFSFDLWGDSNTWSDKDRELCQTLPDLCPPGHVVREKQLGHIRENPDLRIHTHRAAAFYGAVSVCAIAGKCDPEILCRIFFGEMQTFYWRHYGYLENINDEWRIGRLHYIRRFASICRGDENVKGFLEREPSSAE